MTDTSHHASPLVHINSSTPDDPSYACEGCGHDLGDLYDDPNLCGGCPRAALAVETEAAR